MDVFTDEPGVDVKYELFIGDRETFGGNVPLSSMSAERHSE
jgi:hypothetical protein